MIVEMNRKFMDWLRWQMASPDERERITRQREMVERIGKILRATFGPHRLSTDRLFATPRSFTTPWIPGPSLGKRTFTFGKVE